MLGLEYSSTTTTTTIAACAPPPTITSAATVSGYVVVTAISVYNITASAAVSFLYLLSKVTKCLHVSLKICSSHDWKMNRAKG